MHDTVQSIVFISCMVLCEVVLDHCFTSYLIAFLAQLNPLFGPIIKNGIVGHMRKVWSGIPTADFKYPCKLDCFEVSHCVNDRQCIYLQVTQVGSIAVILVEMSNC